MRDDSHHGDPPGRPPGCTCSGAAGSDSGQCPVCGPQPHAKMVTIVEKREFDFSDFEGGSTVPDIYVVLCPALCVLAYTRLRLSVRVHALSMDVGQMLRFCVWNTLPSDEDPAQDFVEADSLTTAEITSDTAVPSLVTSAVAYDPNAYVKISILVVQSDPPVDLTATLSVSLLLRMD